jgi:hypothetical protein
MNVVRTGFIEGDRKAEGTAVIIDVFHAFVVCASKPLLDQR